MSFFFPDDPASLVQALLDGLQLGEDGMITGDLSDFSAQWANQNSALEDYLATQASTVLEGTLDGSGAATIAHGLTSVFGLLSVQAWCKGAAATDYAACSVDSVNASDVVLSGGSAGQPVRVYLVYSIVPPGW